MQKRRTVALNFLSCFLLLGTVFAQPPTKKTVNSQSDLPRFTYSVKGSASELVQAENATFEVFAKKVQADLDTIFRDYDIKDKSTLRALLSAKLDLQILAGQYQAGLETVDALRAMQEKPAAKLTTGLIYLAAMQSAIDAKTVTGSTFEQTFTKRYRDLVTVLPWDVVQDDIRSSYASSRVYTKPAALGYLKTELDPAVQKSGALDNLEAWDLINTRVDLELMIPLRQVRADVLKQYIAAHNVQKPDIWAARDVTLTNDQELTPVPVGIWDSGVDVSLFPNQLYSDSKPTASGTHGLAFDDHGGPSTTWLYPLTDEQEKAYPEYRELIKGFMDIQYSIDSPEADAVQKKFDGLSADQMHEVFELNKVIGFYIHGTHCAGIAVRGNPAARLVVARFNDQLPDLPFPPTPEWAQRLGADFQQMSEYFRSRNVRVVNMSWSDDQQEFETWLSKTGGGRDPVERKKRAAELYGIWRNAIETAIKNSPNTLFVAAAGNSDSNAGFAGDVPASLHLPNLITVGAVNQAGDETSFTSYGDTVIVDADGYQVESYVPGGAKLKLSGTSMATPNVVNLAAKLFALDPSLTPPQVIELIRQGATTSDDGRRHLIDEQRSVALLQGKK
jgi:subtilisin family serine protease